MTSSVRTQRQLELWDEGVVAVSRHRAAVDAPVSSRRRVAGNAMWQLNLAMSEDEAIQIVDLYDSTGKGEMRYDQLVKDVCAGVPQISASRRVEVPSLPWMDSWPSHFHESGLWSEFEPLRTNRVRMHSKSKKKPPTSS